MQHTINFDEYVFNDKVNLRKPIYEKSYKTVNVHGITMIKGYKRMPYPYRSVLTRSNAAGVQCKHPGIALLEFCKKHTMSAHRFAINASVYGAEMGVRVTAADVSNMVNGRSCCKIDKLKAMANYVADVEKDGALAEVIMCGYSVYKR